MALEDNPNFQAVVAHADAMLEFGRPGLSKSGCPLFAGVVDGVSRTSSLSLIPPPPGVRMGDFNWAGNNLLHDIPFLEVLLQLAKLGRRESYSQAVEDIWTWYAAHAAHPESGLFPWGEHAQWSFADNGALPCGFSEGLRLFREGFIIHEHMRFVPDWFWEGLWKNNPEAVLRFARGLNNHIVDERSFEHNRHAPLTRSRWRDPAHPIGDKGHDHARHSGFFIFDTAFAYAKSSDRALLDWARRKLAWHLDQRRPDGIVRGCVRSPNWENEGQHDSLALSCYDAALVLGRETSEGREFMAHALELFAARARQKMAEVDEPEYPEGSWFLGYWRKAPTPGRGNLDALMARRSGHEAYTRRLLSRARRAAAGAPPPSASPVLTRAYAERLDLALSAYDLSKEREHLDYALRVADWARRDLFRNGLFMGVANMLYGPPGNAEYYAHAGAQQEAAGRIGHPGYYFSGTGTPDLLRGLLRLALLQEGREDSLGLDLHYR